MKSQERICVTITSVRGLTSRGAIDHIVWDRKERTQRGLKALGISWGLAIFSVLIPLLHFVLVPALLLLGPVAYFFAAGQEEALSGGKGICPECGKEFEIVAQEVKWPISDLCNHCKNQLKITPENGVIDPN